MSATSGLGFNAKLASRSGFDASASTDLSLFMLTGQVTSNPAVRRSHSQGKFCVFDLRVVSESFDGVSLVRASQWKIYCFGRLADHAAKKVVRGCYVLAIGTPKTLKGSDSGSRVFLRCSKLYVDVSKPWVDVNVSVSQ